MMTVIYLGLSVFLEIMINNNMLNEFHKGGACTTYPVLDLLFSVLSLREMASKVREVLDYFRGLSFNGNLRRGFTSLAWSRLVQHFIFYIEREGQSSVGF